MVDRMADQGRRRWLAWMGAGLGVAATAGVAWWSWRRQSAAHGADTMADTTVDAALAALWQQQWPTPSGGVLAMQSLRGKPIVLNFWASWCAPCVQEMPMLDDFFAQTQGAGWQVLGLAADKMESVQRFLSQHPVTYPVAVVDTAGIALSRTLGNLVGGLPFTIVLDSQGRVLQRKMGRLQEGDLAAWKALK
ncbi:redoxin family protein [Curvibacter sp. CHRR-16]|uniref:TlpA family protein disulfide reductase n=1 Tax=Curvibacter sp. CHRR-16 TaxID=2835872 RepID=UPI001BD9A61C|nr:TlpA disulfide reductase family protein [Curvibacter sp. CHRR-16]MBT0569367.1 redoxin family protein [Curvibacter sp. CHRR-16]